MKKIMSIISMVCVCFSMAFGSAIPVNAEGTGCSTCGIEDTDGSIQKTLEEVLDYTDEEKELVMDSVKNSPYYEDNIDFIENSDRINVYKNDTADSYFTVSYIQKDNEQITGTLIFAVNQEYEIEGVFGTEKNLEKSEIELKDYFENTTQVYSVQPRSDCYTLRCTRQEVRGTSTDVGWGCDVAIGLSCGIILQSINPIIAYVVCRIGVVAACTSTPAGMYCAQMTRVNVCPY